MHKVASTKYTFNDNLTYFIGPNGAGKSTILQAVQLGLLGYVPGLPKTAEGIFSHANGPVMSVTVDVDDNGSDIQITRSWMKSGSSVKSTVTINPATVSESYISDCIGDMELPQFNFSEFNALTANKMKDWFIDFLPKVDANIDWKDQLTSSLASAGMTVNEDFINDLLEDLNNAFTATNAEGVDQVRKANDVIKDKTSFIKGQLAAAESTVKSLIYYDDADTSLDIDMIDSKIADLTELRIALARYETTRTSAMTAKASAENQIAEVEALLKDSIEDPEKYKADLDAVTSELEHLTEEFTNARAEWQSAQKTYTNLLAEKITDKCPMLGCACDKLDELKAAHEAKVKEAEEAVSKAKMLHEEVERKYSEVNSKKIQLSKAYTEAAMKAEKHEAAKLKLDKLKKTLEEVEAKLAEPSPTDRSQADIIAEIDVLTDQGRKHRANEEYNKLIDKFTKDKFERQSELEALKIWAKLTDANGLQTELMDAVFVDFEDKLTAVLKTVFSDESASAKFNLSSKANSFSFGIIRDSKYIKYDLLSSGEKCLYTFSMIVTLLRSNSGLNLMLVDDAFDHLDDNGVKKLFEAAKELKDIQFIFAGVKNVEGDFVVEVK